jgi:hypothetical protein
MQFARFVQIKKQLFFCLYLAMQEVAYTLADYQDHFICSDDRVVSIIGAKGSSKTWSLARCVAYNLATQPKSQGLVMANSRQQILDIFEQDIRTLFDELNWKYSFNAQSLNVKVFDSVIHLRSADPDAVKKVESIAYHWGCADEASYYDQKTLETFVSRIRKGKKIVRITSMPDEPDHYMYGFIENLVAELGGKLYEISLDDNPDKEFVDHYKKILRATYSGAQLERFLSGKRVSLKGEGLFPVESHMRQDIQINPNDDLLLSWDFNVEYRAVSAWQKIGINERGLPIVAVVDSWQLKNSTVNDDAHWLADHLKFIKGRIFLHGDASGENRTAQVTDSMWKTVRDAFNSKFQNIRYITPKSNPPVKDTIQCLSWALRSGLVLFNQAERNVYMSLQSCRADKYGEIDKSNDYKEGVGAKSHETDTARYAAFHYFQHLYPGNKGGFWVV